jgi:complement component 1 Q subcomponent-binding protein
MRGEGTTDLALAQKLAEEIAYEREAAAQESGEPDFVKDFKAQGKWQIAETPGADEVTMTRKFGNETIRLMFSIADVQNQGEDVFEDQEGGEGETIEPTAEVYPIRCSLSITKSTGPGALNMDALCQEGAFLVDNVSFYPDAAIGTDLTAEADWKRRGLYIGPQFDTLDVSVQEEFERFLQERGIDESLATFVPEYCEYKEQKEYVKWLNNVKSFIEL